MKISKRQLLFFFFFISQFTTQAQWYALDNGVSLYGVRVLYADSIKNNICVGMQAPNKVDVWKQNHWDSIPLIEQGGYIQSMVRYNNKLYVAGSIHLNFLNNNYLNQSYSCATLSAFNGINWELIAVKKTSGSIYPYNCGVVDYLMVHNNELYCFGDFDSIGGIAASRVARYDGTNWYAFPLLSNWGLIGTAIFYKGELYVGGNFDGGTNKKDIARWDGAQWQAVGNGLTGGGTWVNSLYIYQDTLIIAGLFSKVGGDPGNNIAKWDGNVWSELGTGLLPTNVWAVIGFDNSLFAGGQINSAGGVPASFIAKWNGSRWYDVGAKFNGVVTSFAALNNELYVGGAFDSINNLKVNCIAKYTGTTGVFEAVNNATEPSIYPNPGTEIITIKSNVKGHAVFTVTDLLGREVYSKELLKNIETLDVRHFHNGIYFYKLTNSEGEFRSGKWVKN